MKEDRRDYNASLCGGVRPLLSPYIDGRTTPTEAELVEAHVAGCEACRAELAQLRGLVQALRALPQVAPPRSFTLPASGARSARTSFFANVLWLRRAAAGLAACLVLLFGLGPYLGSAYQTAAPMTARPAAVAERQAPALAAQATAATPYTLQSGGQADASKAAVAGEPTPQATPVARPAAAAAPAAQAPAQAPSAEPAAPRLAAPPATAAATPQAPAQEGAGPQVAATPTFAAQPADKVAGKEAASVPAPTPITQGRPALWIAQFALALAFLLALVGAFLGPRSRSD